MLACLLACCCRCLLFMLFMQLARSTLIHPLRYGTHCVGPRGTQQGVAGLTMLFMLFMQ